MDKEEIRERSVGRTGGKAADTGAGAVVAVASRGGAVEGAEVAVAVAVERRAVASRAVRH